MLQQRIEACYLTTPAQSAAQTTPGSGIFLAVH